MCFPLSRWIKWVTASIIALKVFNKHGPYQRQSSTPKGTYQEVIGHHRRSVALAIDVHQGVAEIAKYTHKLTTPSATGPMEIGQNQL